MTTIRLSAVARSEFLKEVAYYEDIQKGLGGRFRKATTAAFLKSAEFPLRGKPGIADTRRVLVDGFPFSIVYKVEKTGIVVHAVAHLSRKPAYWLERLSDSS